ncbi:sugar ABC transporter permease [Solihabitans fulvus]|uniref:Sugar ABC transporter permease n=1 Tax=Solihabitans fulvus TaxID=1892852 RepID=A0A5B2XBW1_9PSEU|nr:sugar ABC transporter permease [Solihabitans fulvus]KAA2260675.1 sugar ABC transporter permease [Solihabitans fulvus]
MRRKLPGEGRTAVLFLAPLFLVYALYFAYSFWFLIGTSFTKVSIGFSNAVAVGWKNYRLLLTDPAFLTAIRNNLLFAAASIAVSLTVAFAIAVLLASGIGGRRLYYAIFLVPALTPIALVATVFSRMLQYQDGALNQGLRAIGLDGLTEHWLTDSGWAFLAVIGLLAYLIGLPIMYYTADLAALRTDVLEAAVLDGAGPLLIMRNVIHPMMRSTHITVTLALLLGSFRAFEVVLLSTGGGPDNTTEIVGTYTYRFVTSAGSTIGYASAASVLVLIVAMLVSVVQVLVTRTKRGASR